MKIFTCQHCGQLLFFENYRCVKCGNALGFLAEDMQMYALQEKTYQQYALYGKPETNFRYCKNHEHGACNWLVDATQYEEYCRACALNNTIPNLSNPAHLERWKNIEIAKHRLVYSLLNLNLPLSSKTNDPESGLSFDFLADLDGSQRVMTGHANGLITINVAEADDIEREMARRAMHENYRTLLGHFRHEVGHYYWDRLIAGTEHLETYRSLFGDEQQDYAEALKRHYAQGAPQDWNQRYISTYASSHAWEDWAETWAHYLHIIDTLETAQAYGLSIHPAATDTIAELDAEILVNPYRVRNFDIILSLWLPLTFAMNSLNRSMGHHDMYPFVIPPAVAEKLKFIHKICLMYR